MRHAKPDLIEPPKTKESTWSGDVRRMGPMMLGREGRRRRASHWRHWTTLRAVAHARTSGARHCAGKSSSPQRRPPRGCRRVRDGLRGRHG